MLIAYMPLFIALAGLLLWLISTNPKAQMIGEIVFACGLFWFVYALTGKTVRLL